MSRCSKPHVSIVWWEGKKKVETITCVLPLQIFFQTDNLTFLLPTLEIKVGFKEEIFGCPSVLHHNMHIECCLLLGLGCLGAFSLLIFLELLSPLLTCFKMQLYSMEEIWTLDRTVQCQFLVAKVVPSLKTKRGIYR